MTLAWEVVYLGLGGNVGRREGRLRRALIELEKIDGVTVEKKSSVYETFAVGPSQRAFLNMAVKIRTSLGPYELLAQLKRIEKKLGRKKTVRWGPRVIDLDILVYGGRKIRSRRLTVPHRELSARKFVLEPLREIEPRLKPEGLGKTVARLASELTDPTQKVKILS